MERNAIHLLICDERGEGMRRSEFLTELKTRLSGLPVDDAQDALGYYEEMINDRMDSGMSEEEAVAELGTPAEVASAVLGEISLYKLVKARIRPKEKRSTTAKVLLWVGSPIWLSLAIVAIAVVLSLYASIWAVVVSLWASIAALWGCALGAVAGLGLFIYTGYPLTAFALFACGLVCAGIAILLGISSKYVVKAMVWLTKMLGLGIKRCFVRKENNV